MVKKIEQERLQILKDQAIKLKERLVGKGRCHICTLPPPCKHSISLIQEEVYSQQDSQIQDVDNSKILLDNGEEVNYDTDSKPRQIIYQHVNQSSRDYSPNEQNKISVNHGALDPHHKTMMMFGPHNRLRQNNPMNLSVE